MVTRVNPSLPAVVNQSRSYAKPLVAMLALAALAYVLFQVAKSLIGRVQSMRDPGKLHREGSVDFNNKLYDEAIKKFTVALECNPDKNLRELILTDRAAAYIIKQQYDKAIEDLTGAL